MLADSDSTKAFVQGNSYLTLHYRITILTGAAANTVFMDTFSGRPATLQMGVGQWAPGLEGCLLGRAEGSSFSVDLPAEQAYGEHNPQLVQRLGLDVFRASCAPGTSYEPGDVVEFSAPDGQLYSGVLKQLGDDWVLIDFNHPMAGADLRVEVSLLGVL